MKKYFKFIYRCIIIFYYHIRKKFKVIFNVQILNIAKVELV